MQSFTILFLLFGGRLGYCVLRNQIKVVSRRKRCCFVYSPFPFFFIVALNVLSTRNDPICIGELKSADDQAKSKILHCFTCFFFSFTCFLVFPFLLSFFFFFLSLICARVYTISFILSFLFSSVSCCVKGDSLLCFGVHTISLCV